MKRIGGYALSISLRIRVPLEGYWDFLSILDGHLNYPPPDERWLSAQVPCFHVEPEHFFWHRRRFVVPEEMRNKRVKVEFLGLKSLLTDEKATL